MPLAACKDAGFQSIFFGEGEELNQPPDETLESLECLRKGTWSITVRFILIG
jgi:hypothetical protein